jgi:hypothetical protein
VEPLARKQIKPARLEPSIAGYDAILSDIVELLESARRASARAVNAFMTAAYWETGRRIVELEQGGMARAEYGQALLQRLAGDLTARLGRGFSERNLRQMRSFYLGWQIFQTAPSELKAQARLEFGTKADVREIRQTLSAESPFGLTGPVRSTSSSANSPTPTPARCTCT